MSGSPPTLRELKGTLATYDLFEALRRNPTWIMAGADICAVAADRIEALEAENAALKVKLAQAESWLEIGRMSQSMYPDTVQLQPRKP